MHNYLCFRVLRYIKHDVLIFDMILNFIKKKIKHGAHYSLKWIEFRDINYQ